MNAKETLKTYFGYDSFRDGQEDMIESLLSGRDGFAIMPTGAGKSICYQIPALMLPGITLVISPLISLMQDQVKALNAAGIHAAFINSSLTETQIRKALSLAASGTYKIIYVAPERLVSYEFLDFACHTEISMITVDEAHCISQWGQDFRPSYLKIVEFIRQLPKRPIVSAFTATATEQVKNDIQTILNLENPKVLVTGFDRENLYYRVEAIRKKDDFILDFVGKHRAESGIIYCATRKNVDKIFQLLFKSGIPVTKYHAGIDNETRKKNQDDFIYDRAQVIVATNAFGCVAEMRGRYGLTLVIGTLRGANQARLRELGMVDYKSYGILKEYSEPMVRTLINQLLEEGYLYQTEDKYSVLKMGDIEPLKDEHTKVILKTYEQKETSKKKKVKKQRSTGALTSLGSELFEELRKLRLEIARAESLPPYIVFNDKTLIDMCLKQPKTPGEFLDVSGVGQSKLEKYGDRFLDVIKSFTETHSEEISKGMDFATEEIDFTK